jgi:putative spermidine/putrescine transport system permease protein
MNAWATRVFFALVGLFLLLPAILVTGVSLNRKKMLLFPPVDVSGHWYADMLGDPAWMGPIGNSLLIAGVAALISVLIALPLALGFWRKSGLLVRALYTLGMAPFILPPVIVALGLLVFWRLVGWQGTIWNDMISHGVFFVTLPLVTITLGLSTIDRSLIEAARTMGASRQAVFGTVLLPLLRPYLVSGYAFVFVLSLNEYIIAWMVAGFTVETLPIKIFNSLRYGYTPIMGAAAVLFMGVTIVTFAAIAKFGDLVELLGGKSER